MKTVYKALLERIRIKVPQIRWIDLDRGQLTFPKENYTIDFPAVLISFGQTDWGSIGEGVRQGDCPVTIRIAFPLYYDTNNHTADYIRDQGLDQMSIVDDVDQALDGFSAENFNQLQLLHSYQEEGQEGFLVFNYTYMILVSKVPESDKIQKTVGASVSAEL
jgi:hypothetical protein